MTNTLVSPKKNKLRGFIRYKAGVKPATISALLLLTACASSLPPPTAAIESAETAIASAEQAQVGEHAMPELSEARDKLNLARTAVRNEKMLLAKQLAEESQIVTMLALAKAEEVNARAINLELQQTIDAMKQEMQRNTGVSQ